MQADLYQYAQPSLAQMMMAPYLMINAKIREISDHLYDRVLREKYKRAVVTVDIDRNITITLKNSQGYNDKLKCQIVCDGLIIGKSKQKFVRKVTREDIEALVRHAVHDNHIRYTIGETNVQLMYVGLTDSIDSRQATSEMNKKTYTDDNISIEYGVIYFTTEEPIITPRFTADMVVAILRDQGEYGKSSWSCAVHHGDEISIRISKRDKVEKPGMPPCYRYTCGFYLGNKAPMVGIVDYDVPKDQSIKLEHLLTYMLTTSMDYVNNLYRGNLIDKCIIVNNEYGLKNTLYKREEE